MNIPKLDKNNRMGAIFLIVVILLFIFSNIEKSIEPDIETVKNDIEVKSTGTVNLEFTEEDEELLIQKIKEVSSVLKSKYTQDPNKKLSIDKDDLINSAIRGVVSVYKDPHTSYLEKIDASFFEDDVVEGEFSGVGIEITVESNKVKIQRPIPDGPAEKAGVEAGDFILEVNGEDIVGQSTNAAAKLIRGPVGKIVTLKIERDGKSFDIDVRREKIEIYKVETEAYDDAFLIRLQSFTNKTPEQFKEALYKFRDSGTSNLIVDLRSNPGGILDVGVFIASFFTERKDIILYEYLGEDQDLKAFKGRGFNVFTDKLKLVVLIDQNSASASEILAAALRKYSGATLIGSTSFGKGSVQELVALKDGSKIKVTVGHWLTPDKVSITTTGIKPDISAVDLKSTEEDEVIKRALKFFKE